VFCHNSRIEVRIMNFLLVGTSLNLMDMRVNVTPRSRGYEDVTAMYIRGEEIPSHPYAKY